MNKSSTNYNAIDLAKFICAILVIIIHVPPFGYDSRMEVVLNFGLRNYIARIAVPFFFITSGYFLYQKTDFNNFSTLPAKKYIIKILRLYILWSIIYFPLCINSIVNNTHGLLYGVLLYIQNFIFEGGYIHLWYLSATILGVFIITVLLSRHFSIKFILTSATILYCFGLLAQSWFGIILPLKIYAPQLWSLLKFIQSIIHTTRNGLFEGFLFISIGM